MSCAGSRSFIEMAKYSPAGPPPMHAIFICLPGECDDRFGAKSVFSRENFSKTEPVRVAEVCGVRPSDDVNSFESPRHGCLPPLPVPVERCLAAFRIVCRSAHDQEVKVRPPSGIGSACQQLLMHARGWIAGDSAPKQFRPSESGKQHETPTEGLTNENASARIGSNTPFNGWDQLVSEKAL